MGSFQRLLLIGEAGAGKTMTLYRLFYETAQPIFSYSALLFWTFFSTSLSFGPSAMIRAAELMRREDEAQADIDAGRGKDFATVDEMIEWLDSDEGMEE